MNHPIDVREASLDDVRAVHGLISEFSGEVFDFEGPLKGSIPLILVATYHGQPAGYSISYDKFKDGSLYCWMAGVADDKRRHGVYQALADFRELWARKNGFKSLKLKTWNKRRGMLSWLIGQGWMIVGMETYPQVDNHRILFEKAL